MKETLIYKNALDCEESLKGFILEGKAKLTFPDDCLRMENSLESGLGQKANYVLWCPEEFPSDVSVRWHFKPLSDTGLCILFFSARGIDGTDIFSSSLQERTGEYHQYHSGEINTFHVSYFRRKELDERAFHTCNLRKSKGFHLVAQGADPLPNAEDVDRFYQMEIRKRRNVVSFSIDGLPIFSYLDDGLTHGGLLDGGKIGFRQLAPLTAEYKNLEVFALSE
jgi:hypothetical protein